MKAHDDEITEISNIAKVLLQSISEQLVITDEYLRGVPYDGHNYVHDELGLEGMRYDEKVADCANWLEVVKVLNKKAVGYRNEHLGALEDEMKGYVAGIHEAAQERVLDAVKEQLKNFMDTYNNSDLKKSGSQSIYALIIMEQVLQGKVGGFDLERLIYVKQYLEKISEDDPKKNQGMRKVVAEFIVPAVFLANKDSAKCAKEYVKLCEEMNGNKKMDKADKQGLLKALEIHMDSIYKKTEGSLATKHLACHAEGVKVLEAIRKSPTFSPSKIAGPSAKFKGKDDISEKLSEYKKEVLEAKEEISAEKKEEKERIKEEKNDARRGYKSI